MKGIADSTYREKRFLTFPEGNNRYNRKKFKEILIWNAIN